MPKKVASVLYLCDGKACECPTCCAHNGTGECHHTTKWEHALHKDADPSEFLKVPLGDDEIILVEPFDD